MYCRTCICRVSSLDLSSIEGENKQELRRGIGVMSQFLAFERSTCLMYGWETSDNHGRCNWTRERNNWCTREVIEIRRLSRGTSGQFYLFFFENKNKQEFFPSSLNEEGWDYERSGVGLSEAKPNLWIKMLTAPLKSPEQRSTTPHRDQSSQ